MNILTGNVLYNIQLIFGKTMQKKSISTETKTLIFYFVSSCRDETLEALSDAQVVAPAALTVDLHSADHRNSFLYVFDYQTKFGDYPQVNVNPTCLRLFPICSLISSIDAHMSLTVCA